jgi:hypothetical protein
MPADFLLEKYEMKLPRLVPSNDKKNKVKKLKLHIAQGSDAFFNRRMS